MDVRAWVLALFSVPQTRAPSAVKAQWRVAWPRVSSGWCECGLRSHQLCGLGQVAFPPQPLCCRLLIGGRNTTSWGCYKDLQDNICTMTGTH